MPITTIPNLSSPPNSISRPGSFNSDSDTTFQELPVAIAAFNANVPALNAAVSAAMDAQAAAATAVAAGDFKGAWGSLAGALAIPASVFHNGNAWGLLENIPNVALEEPGVSAKWFKLTQDPPLGLGAAAPTSQVVTLAADSAAYQRINPPGPFRIHLPDATALRTGVPMFTLENASTFCGTVYDATGVKLGFVPPLSARVLSLADNTTAAGVWSDTLDLIAVTAASGNLGGGSYSTSMKVRALRLSNAKEVLVFTNAQDVYAVVFDEATSQFGAPTLIRAYASFPPSGLALSEHAVDTVLVVSSHEGGGTTMHAVVLTLTGTAIAVGTPATATATATGTLAFLSKNGNNYCYVRYSASGAAFATPLSVSGTTVTLGASASPGAMGTLYTVMLDLGGGYFFGATLGSAGNIRMQAFSFTGTTVTGGADVTIADVHPSNLYLAVRLLNTGRVLIAYCDAALATTIRVRIASIVGTVVNTSTITVTDVGSWDGNIFVVGGDRVVVWSASAGGKSYVVWDNAGTPVAGAAFTNGSTYLYDQWLIQNSSSLSLVQYDYSTGAAVSTPLNYIDTSAGTSLPPAFNANLTARDCERSYATPAGGSHGLFNLLRGRRLIAAPWSSNEFSFAVKDRKLCIRLGRIVGPPWKAANPNMGCYAGADSDYSAMWLFGYSHTGAFAVQRLEVV